MRWAGVPCCYTNRAGIWAFITRDKSVQGVWRHLSFGTIAFALNHYLRQAILVRCPNYEALRTTHPAAADKVRLTAGEDAFEDVCGDQTLGEQIEGQHPKLAGRLGNLTFAAVQHEVNSRNAQIGMEKRGAALLETAEKEIWSVTGEGGHSQGRSATAAPLARQSDVLALQERRRGR
jgi:hypothetical protein